MIAGKEVRSGLPAGRQGLAAVAFVFALLPVLVHPANAKAAGSPPRFCRVATAESALAASSGDDLKPQDRRVGGVMLLVSNTEPAVGTPVYARLANFSVHRAGYGLEFKIERWTALGWELDPASPRGPWPRVLGRLRPGSAGRCYQFDIPAEQPEGLYRFVTHTYLHLGGRPSQRTAKFRVG